MFFAAHLAFPLVIYIPHQKTGSTAGISKLQSTTCIFAVLLKHNHTHSVTVSRTVSSYIRCDA